MVQDLLLFGSELCQLSHIVHGKDTIRRAREERSNSMVKRIWHRIHTIQLVLNPCLGFILKGTQLMDDRNNANGAVTMGKKRPSSLKPVSECRIIKPRTVKFEWVVTGAPFLVPFKANRVVIEYVCTVSPNPVNSQRRDQGCKN